MVSMGSAWVSISPTGFKDFAVKAKAGITAALKGVSGEVPVTVNTKGAVADIAALKARMEALSKIIADTRMDVDDAAMQAKLSALQTKVLTLAGTLSKLKLNADTTALDAKIAAITASIESLKRRIPKMKFDADTKAAQAKILALQAESALLTDKRRSIEFNIDAKGLAAAETTLVGLEAAYTGLRKASVGAAGSFKILSASAGGFFGTLTTGRLALFGGITSVGILHLALDAIIETLAVVVPAVVTAAAGLGAFALAASDSAKQVYQMVTSIHTVGDAMNATIPPMTGKLEALHNQVRPQVWQLYGDAIDIVHTKTGLFNKLALQTGNLLDQLAAHFTVLITQSGPGLAKFLAAGKRDLAELGRIALSLGDAFVKLIKITQETHIAEYLLNIVGAAAKLLDMITKFPIPLLAMIVGFHGIVIWGGLAASVFLKMLNPLFGLISAAGGISRTAGAVAGLGDKASRLERLKAAAKDIKTEFATAGANIAGFGGRIKSIGTTTEEAAGKTKLWSRALSFFSAGGAAPWVLGIAAGTVAVGAIVYWFTRAKNATDQWADSVRAVVQRATLFNVINVTARELAATNVRLAEAYHQVTHATNAYRGSALQAARDVKTVKDVHNELTQELGREVSRISGVAHEYKYSLPGAMALATFAGVKLWQLTSKQSSTWEKAKQRIQGTIDAYKAMGQGSSQLGNDISAINVAASDQAKAITNLNTAWDSFIKIVGAPVDTFLTFSQTLVRFGNDATVAGARMTGLGSGIIGISKKVTNSSIQLQQDFQASFEAANQLFDAMRSSQAPANQQIKAIKDTVATLIPLAGTSKVAAAEISSLAQEAAGPATTNLQTLQKWAGITAKQGMKGLQKDTNNAAISMSNLSRDAAKLGSTLQNDLNKEMSRAVENAVGLQGAMNKYTKSLHDNGAAASETRKDRQQLFKDLMAIFHNADQANATIKTLSGAFTDNAAAASHGKKDRNQVITDFKNQAQKAKDARDDLSKYTNEIISNGVNSSNAKAARDQLVKDLISAGVHSNTAKADVKAYTDAIRNHSATSDAVRGARQRLIQDILNASKNSRTGKTDIDRLSDAIRNHGTHSDQARSARQRLITDLENAGIQAKTARGLVDGLTTSITHIPKNPNVVIHMRGDGKYTITGAGPRAIPNGPPQLKPLATGGRVPGSGQGDTVPAMLTPGEVVVPKGMVRAGLVDHLRGHLPGFAGGGLVTRNMVPGNDPNILPTAMNRNFGHAMIGSITQAMADSINKAVAAARAAAQTIPGGVGGPGGGAPAANAALARQMMPAWGSGAEWNAWNYVAMRESGWNQFARNPSSGAFGIPQSLPPSKMGAAAVAGNVRAQISWMISYIRSVYGDPIRAAQHEATHNWYGGGGLVADNGTTLAPGWNMRYNGTGKPEPLTPAVSSGGVSPGEAAIIGLLRQLIHISGQQGQQFGRALNGAASMASLRGGR